MTIVALRAAAGHEGRRRGGAAGNRRAAAGRPRRLLRRRETAVTGAPELRNKESDRITTVVDGLRGLGAGIEETEGRLCGGGGSGLPVAASMPPATTGWRCWAPSPASPRTRASRCAGSRPPMSATRFRARPARAHRCRDGSDEAAPAQRGAVSWRRRARARGGPGRCPVRSLQCDGAADEATLNAILAELLGEVGEGVTVKPPFRCDYGYRTRSARGRS